MCSKKHYQEYYNGSANDAHQSQRCSLTASSGSGCLRARLGRHPEAFGDRARLRSLSCARLARLGCGAVPIVQHLSGKNDVEAKAGDEAVENELVVDLLESCEDAREGTGEVVEDLVRHQELVVNWDDVQ